MEKNKFQAIISCAVALLRYGPGIIKWSNEELQSLDRKSRKLLTVHGTFYPRSDVDRLYLPRGKGGRGLVSCECCVRAGENGIGWYVKNTVEPLLVLVREGGIISKEECMAQEEYKRSKTEEREQKWSNKKIYGQYCSETSDYIDKEKRWLWWKKSDLKAETEALFCAAQEQA